MLSRPQLWQILSFMALGMLPACRGSYPLARSVQVTREPGLDAPDVDAPPQRLATAKPRVGSELPSQVAPVAHQEESPHNSPQTRMRDNRRTPQSDSVSQYSVGDMPSDIAPNERPITTPARNSMPVSNRTIVRQGNTQVEAARKTVPDAHHISDTISNIEDLQLRTASVQTSLSHRSADDEPIDLAKLPAGANEMLDAFKNSPPEVQQQALRQLIAAATRTAESTTRPRSIDTAILESLADAHELPPQRNSPPTEAPAQISNEVEPTNANVSQPVTATASLSPPTRDAAIQQVSHSQTDQVPAPRSVVSRAVAESEPESVPEIIDDESPSPKTANVKTLSESALYNELVNRLSQANADESAADRSRRLVTLRHLMVLSGNVDDAVRGIDEMPEQEQEYLRHQLLGLWTIIDPDGHPVPGRRFTAALPQLRQATNHLSAATDSLEVRSLAFCTEIESYGQIKKFPSTRFKAGQQVILYCEIENFVAVKVNDGYETNLQGSYDVFNETGEKVASQLLPADRQVSNNYLRDYFIAYQMNLPKELPPGKYRLQLTLEDITGKKFGQAAISYEIVR